MQKSFPADRLCDRDAGYGTLQCYWTKGSCPGSADSYCYPYDLWSGELRSGYEYYTGHLVSGSLDAGTHTYRITTYAFTVRCLLLARYHTIYRRTQDETSPLSPQATVCCVLDLNYFKIFNYAQAYSVQTAARAHSTATATRTLYGHTPKLQVTAITMFLT